MLLIQMILLPKYKTKRKYEMRGAEWSLILFTLLTQLAIGMFLVIQAVNFTYLSKPSNLAGKEIVLKILLAIIVVLVLAIRELNNPPLSNV